MTTPESIPFPKPEVVDHQLELLDAAVKHLDDALADAEGANVDLSSAPVLQAALEAISIARDGEPDNSAHISAAEVIYEVLDYYRRDLRILSALVGVGADPAVQYTRLLQQAEGMAERNPAAAEALAKIADRWLSDALISARKRTERGDGATIHFGSPQ